MTIAIASVVEVDEKKTGRRSRGWTPLKYPKSAIFADGAEAGSFPYFPLHPDVLSAAVRELFILEGKLDSLTLQISPDKTVAGEHCSAKFQSSTPSFNNAEVLACSTAGNPRKRKINRSICGDKAKWARVEYSDQRDDHVDTPLAGNTRVSQTEIREMNEKCSGRRARAEDMVSSVVKSVRVASHSTVLPNEGNGTSDILPAVVGRPRKVSEADQAVPLNSAASEQRATADIIFYNDDHSEACSREISCFLDLSRRDENGSFPLISAADDIPPMLHASISNEALLRDATMTMTTKLIQNFQERSLRLFFGYKTPVISRDRLAQLMAGFLFDASHAMFAWVQTEQEVLSHNPNLVDPDTTIRQSLFNQRALNKLGGFKPHGILPQAISIGRLRRRNLSWEEFAKTAQGIQMLAHHTKQKTAISAGKQRRGQRLRQRHWLTSALLWQDNEDASITTAPRSRSNSIASETDDEIVEPSVKLDADLTRQSRILADMPGSRSVALFKELSSLSWGVGLVQEGSACVVGRAQSHPDGSRKDSYLQCGDMILYVQNENGEEAGSPICSWFGSQPMGEDWFQRIVDLFKNSTELHLVIQRV